MTCSGTHRASLAECRTAVFPDAKPVFVVSFYISGTDLAALPQGVWGCHSDWGTLSPFRGHGPGLLHCPAMNVTVPQRRIVLQLLQLLLFCFESAPKDMFIDLRERNIDMREKYWSVASRARPDQRSNPNVGMYPDRESNLQPFGVMDDAPIKWATGPGPVQLLNVFSNIHVGEKESIIIWALKANSFLYISTNYFLKDFIYVCTYWFLERGGRERGRKGTMCKRNMVRAPNWWPGWQHRHVPWLGIEPPTLQFADDTQPTEPQNSGPNNFYMV